MRSGRVFAGNDVSVEVEEDCAEVAFGRFGGIWLEVRPDVGDEGGTDGGEQTGLGTRSTMWGGNWSAETRENQGGIEVLIGFFHALGIVLRRLSFVRGVEIGGIGR